MTQFVGGVLGPYMPRNQACDEFMTDYCAKDGSNYADIACNCFREQDDIRERVPDSVLPVRCLGQSCSFAGYQTDNMYNQGCSVTICQQIIELHGTDLIDASSGTLYCGYQSYAIGNTPTPTTVTPVDNGDDGVPFYTWIIIAVVLVVASIVAGVLLRPKQ